MEQEKLFDEQRNQIEKDKKVLNVMIREREEEEEEEKRKEEEKKRLKEMSIKLAEEKEK